MNNIQSDLYNSLSFKLPTNSISIVALISIQREYKLDKFSALFDKIEEERDTLVISDSDKRLKIRE